MKARRRCRDVRHLTTYPVGIQGLGPLTVTYHRQTLCPVQTAQAAPSYTTDTRPFHVASYLDLHSSLGPPRRRRNSRMQVSGTGCSSVGAIVYVALAGGAAGCRRGRTRLGIRPETIWRHVHGLLQRSCRCTLALANSTSPSVSSTSWPRHIRGHSRQARSLLTTRSGHLIARCVHLLGLFVLQSFNEGNRADAPRFGNDVGDIHRTDLARSDLSHRQAAIIHRRQPFRSQAVIHAARPCELLLDTCGTLRRS